MTEYKIYKIVSPQTNRMYIGSTSKTLKTRLSKHKQDYKTWLVDNLKCVSSFEILKFNDHVIELIETCVYIDKLERNENEGYHIKLNQLICVNKKIEGRTHKEYRDTRKEKKKQYDNEYSETHKEQKKQQAKQYYQDNQEKINERVNQKHTCGICNSIYTQAHKSRHEATNKHIKQLS